MNRCAASFSLYTHNYLLVGVVVICSLVRRFFFWMKDSISMHLGSVFQFSVLVFFIHLFSWVDTYFSIQFLSSKRFFSEFEIIFRFFFTIIPKIKCCRYIWFDEALLISDQVVKPAGAQNVQNNNNNNNNHGNRNNQKSHLFVSASLRYSHFVIPHLVHFAMRFRCLFKRSEKEKRQHKRLSNTFRMNS